ncbi:uncharacterized protein ACLA_061590 [Aspergillus clavatus NRRL 1]|uniref:Uncharacterized protein n=1 Tax=Aspergillus clavatus (strain ATCC 1007 / CBS 513.65 / DSM 816 / NCTC 3887 / NRRL 1 / QM 1276 / 107) TaxID=344612 RepID=A1CCE0_ASPCL|nr:uncharacterized protein ACLA_061590 [Aspergillus clavatus NRRL 1]EAW12197.1 hypothetical protein ACLA_061590 [Aspergillus clavatus NRRL 1]
MRLNLKHTLLLAASVGIPFKASARAIARQELSAGSLLPRIEIPGFPIPKPVIPKPVVPEAPIGKPPPRTPQIEPVPVPVPKPKPKPPVQQPCKRTGTCDQAYTIFNVNYPEKGRILINNLRENNRHPKTDSHNFATVEKKYKLMATKKTMPIVDQKISEWMKENVGIDLGNILDKDTSWTRYEVWGKLEPEPNLPTVADVFVSVKHQAILAKRLFRENENLYTPGFQLKDRLPMSEWIFQLWKKAVAEGKADYGIDVKLSDLKVIVGTDVDNPAASKIIPKVQQGVGDNKASFTVKASDGEPFEALAASSSGKSKYYMLTDHNGPSELNKLEPQKAEISLEDQGGKPAIAWILGRD